MFISKQCSCPSKKSSCCSPKQLIKLSSDLTIIAVKTRLEILFLLRDKPHCVCDLEAHTGMSQSLISHHTADLGNAGFVMSEREGKYMYYSLTNKGKQVVKALTALLINNQ